VEIALELIAPYPHIQTVNIGGGLPVAYRPDEVIPTWESFAETLTPLLKGYKVILEPGRSIIADAGILVFTALYIKEQAGQRIIISDGSMAELIRPALYQAHHEIVAVDAPHPLTPSPQVARGDKKTLAQVVGPVCETADVIGREMPLQEVQPGDLLAALTAGAYGMVMASNYNQRLRPAEVVVEPDGESWRVARRRETWDDLVRNEV
jgi:diaminopimelate decarboxylase